MIENFESVKTDTSIQTTESMNGYLKKKSDNSIQSNDTISSTYLKKKSDNSIQKDNFFIDLKNVPKKLFGSFKKNSIFEYNIDYLCNSRFLTYEEDKKDFFHYYTEKFIIGEGSSSVVKVCLKKNTYEKYAVKIIRLHGGEELLNDFKNEFLILRDSDSPYLPRVYEFFYNKLKCKIHIVMELIEMPDLSTLVNSMGCLTEYKARKILKRILEGIYYLHTNFICHRDLKPDNILSSKNGETLKIIDFNISKKFDFNSKFDFSSKQNMVMFEPVGNLGFASPEMLVGYSNYTEQVDLWSAGVLLYFMLCGDFPYFNYDKKTLEMMKEGKMEFGYLWEKVSDQGKELVKSLLKYDSNTRLNADQALKHPWFSIELKEDNFQENELYDLDMGKSHEKILRNYYNQVFVDVFSSFNLKINKVIKKRTKSFNRNSKPIYKGKLLAEGKN